MTSLEKNEPEIGTKNYAAPETHDQSRPPESKPAGPARKRFGIIFAATLLLGIAAGAVGWWFYSSTYESTDDAQIGGHLNPIASRVAGTVKAVYLENNQHVEAGQPLLDLDTTDAEISLAQAQAQLDQAVAQLRGEQPNVPITVTSNATDVVNARGEVANAEAALASAEHEYQSNLAQLAQAEANNGKAQSDFERYRQLIEKHEVAQSDYDQYAATAKAQAAAMNSQRSLVASAARTIDQRKAQLDEEHAKLEQSIANAPRQLLIKDATVQQRRASVQSSAAQVRQDKMNLLYCHIVAPVSGLVAQRNAELGARISIGQQLMLVVQTKNLWVTANFKETQLKKVRPGQRVEVKVDGLGKTFAGYVESMPSSTGDITSALPPENATGNYVKIVQRMPLRIRFTENQNALDELRPGMSVVPKIFFK